MTNPNGADLLLSVQSTGAAAAATAGGGNVGNPTIHSATGAGNADAHPATVTETITLTCVVAGGAGVGIFSVTGSLSGPLGYAVVSTGGSPVAFKSDVVDLTVIAGGVNASVNDTFAIAMTAGGFVAVNGIGKFGRKSDTNEQEFACFGKKRFVFPDQRKHTFTLSGWYDTSDAGQAILRDAEANRRLVIVKVLPDGTNGFTEKARVRAFTHDADAEGDFQPLTYEFTGIPDSAVQIGAGPSW